eukprot:CAMPEP_0177651308 /NCGR_PEP_ID=MMETSP0447-20121125/12469_1 /TAXON_ID=0 /ORGANISM="Stygamoeba regulata, Strain BSH-02190019" /LENGTH=75 /DNA_ID=CAMNT_0019154361 /DNA_START=112 /DNA_END=339 /DNA_ORIENTATION=-
MSAAPSTKTHVQTDWEQREFIEAVNVNMRKITEFLNKFDVSTRFRLAKVNEKLTKLERQVAFLEGRLASLQGPQQ